MSVHRIDNEHGVWFDVEEEVHSLYEVQFNKEGLLINGDLICKWKEIAGIAKKLKLKAKKTLPCPTS